MRKLIIIIGTLTVLAGCTSQTSVDPASSRVVDSANPASIKSSLKSQASNQFNFPKASCGDKPIEGENTWYPVFVDGGDLDTIRNQFCADAVSTVRENSQVKSVQLASFTSYDKALEFAKAVGGEVGQSTSPESTENTSDEQKAEPDSESPSPDSSPVPEANNTSAPLTLTAFHWNVNSASIVEFEGQVTNNSDQPIRSLQALAEFYTSDGKFITSTSTFMDINPLMPGQTTPFKGYQSFKFEMETVKIRFKTFNGEISFTDARTKSQEP